MKYYYKARCNVFDKNGVKVGEKVLYTSQMFDKERECRMYGSQYQWQHSCAIEYCEVEEAED